MDAIEAILGRRTVPQAVMREPGPNPDELTKILACGEAAPDHGQLRPWRILVVEGDDRRLLGRYMRDAAATLFPDAPASELDKAAARPLRAPLLLVVIASLDPNHPKIPRDEQLAAASAAAQNMLIAVHALGYAGKWSTGKDAAAPEIRAAFDLGEHDQILGFLYVGRADEAVRPPARNGVDVTVRRWPTRV